MTTTKDKILEATAQIIEHDLSFDQISMNDIASKVGIGKSTIYEYFSSRESLLLSTSYKLFDDYLTLILDLKIDNLNFEQAFKKQIYMIIHEGEKKQLVFRFLINSRSVLSSINENLCEYANNFRESVNERFKQIINIGIKEKSISFINKKIDKVMITGLISGSIFEHFNFHELNDEEFIDGLYQKLIKMIK